MNLYIWSEFAPDYTSGLAFAVADTEQQARELVIDALGADPIDWGPVQIVALEKAQGVACAVYGGG